MLVAPIPISLEDIFGPFMFATWEVLGEYDATHSHGVYLSLAEVLDDTTKEILRKIILSKSSLEIDFGICMKILDSALDPFIVLIYSLIFRLCFHKAEVGDAE